jgi:hypothetical protein
MTPKSSRSKRRPAVSAALVWRGIVVEVACEANWLNSSKGHE